MQPRERDSLRRTSSQSSRSSQSSLLSFDEGVVDVAATLDALARDALSLANTLVVGAAARAQY